MQLSWNLIIFMGLFYPLQAQIFPGPDSLMAGAKQKITIQSTAIGNSNALVLAAWSKFIVGGHLPNQVIVGAKEARLRAGGLWQNDLRYTHLQASDSAKKVYYHWGLQNAQMLSLQVDKSLAQLALKGNRSWDNAAPYLWGGEFLLRNYSGLYWMVEKHQRNVFWGLKLSALAIHQWQEGLIIPNNIWLQEDSLRVDAAIQTETPAAQMALGGAGLESGGFIGFRKGHQRLTVSFDNIGIGYSPAMVRRNIRVDTSFTGFNVPGFGQWQDVDWADSVRALYTSHIDTLAKVLMMPALVGLSWQYQYSTKHSFGVKIHYRLQMFMWPLLQIHWNGSYGQNNSSTWHPGFYIQSGGYRWWGMGASLGWKNANGRQGAQLAFQTIDGLLAPAQRSGFGLHLYYIWAW